MAKFYRRRFYKPKEKYSVEQHSFAQATSVSGDAAIEVVPATGVQGMRKVKHLTVSLTTPDVGSAAGNINAIYWALVYVPAGTSPSPLAITGPELYEPNQFVMNAGLCDPDAGPMRISTPISRNLNSGDTVYLVMRVVSGAAGAVTVYGIVRYAVTFN